jgi:hypothetical protein
MQEIIGLNLYYSNTCTLYLSFSKTQFEPIAARFRLIFGTWLPGLEGPNSTNMIVAL